MKNLNYLFALAISLVVTSSCTKTETVEVEKIVEKEVPVVIDPIKKANERFQNPDNEALIKTDLKTYLLNDEFGKQYDGFFVYSGDHSFGTVGYSNSTIEIVCTKSFEVKEVREYKYGQGYNTSNGIIKVNSMDETLKPRLVFFNNTAWGYMSRADFLAL